MALRDSFGGPPLERLRDVPQPARARPGRWAVCLGSGICSFAHSGRTSRPWTLASQTPATPRMPALKPTYSEGPLVPCH